MTSEDKSSSATGGQRQNNTLVWIAGLTVALVVVTVIGFNTVGRSRFDANLPTQAEKNASPSSAAEKSSATVPEPASASDEKVTLAPATAPSAASSQQIDGKAPDASSGSSATTMKPVGFTPPAPDAFPEGPMGDVVRRGEQIFLNTKVNAPQFVGNSLNCVNCHLDAGRKADSAPLWGAYPLYPAYRSKTKHVDTFAERLRGCFVYSMNGTAPPFGDDVLVALEAYAYWMAKGAPTGDVQPGAGYRKLKAAAQAPDGIRGKAMYEANCALCHAVDGAGQRSGDRQVFPPLWGPQSYNWGAGMHSVTNAAAFIKANMPLGKGGSLSDQEAWDVAWYINSHERPQDPRFTGDVATTRASFHDTPSSLYGTTVNGKVLGSQAY